MRWIFSPMPSVCTGEPGCERAAAADNALEPDLAAVRQHDLFHHRETDARSFRVPVHGRLTSHELVEDSSVFGRRDACARIDDSDENLIVNGRTLDVNRDLTGRVLDRVVNKVANGDSEGVFVGADEQGSVACREIDSHAGVARERLHLSNHSPNEVVAFSVSKR